MKMVTWVFLALRVTVQSFTVIYLKRLGDITVSNFIRHMLEFGSSRQFSTNSLYLKTVLTAR